MPRKSAQRSRNAANPFCQAQGEREGERERERESEEGGGREREREIERQRASERGRAGTREREREKESILPLLRFSLVPSVSKLRSLPNSASKAFVGSVMMLPGLMSWWTICAA